MIQQKIDKLTDILNILKSENQRKYALNLIADIINVINNQEKEITSLQAWKTDNKISEIDCELEKYVLLLIYYGYSQRFINIIRKETIEFIARNRIHFNVKKPDEIKNIDHLLMIFELEFDRLPVNYNEFSKFIKNVKS